MHLQVSDENVNAEQNTVDGQDQSMDGFVDIGEQDVKGNYNINFEDFQSADDILEKKSQYLHW